ncbi:hypothetical protein X975_19016, partial [Stegodyphus mimosarum]
MGLRLHQPQMRELFPMSEKKYVYLFRRGGLIHLHIIFLLPGNVYKYSKSLF